MADLVVAGAGMAGLAAAAEARGLGAEPLVLEKLDRPGGSMRLSSGVIWRHRDFERFREECPEGDERLQRRLFERLDEDLGWLESLEHQALEALVTVRALVAEPLEVAVTPDHTARQPH